jgi:hypothetical protein
MSAAAHRSSAGLGMSSPLRLALAAACVAVICAATFAAVLSALANTT